MFLSVTIVPAVVAFETIELFKCFKKASRIAISPSVHLTSYSFADRGFTTYTMYVFATCKFAPVCFYHSI